MARYTMRENRWYTRLLRRKERAVAWPLAKSFWEKVMLLSPLLVPVNCRNWRMEKYPECGHDVEKASLVFGVAEAAKVGETGLRKVHRLKMTVFNSRSSRMRRKRSASPRRA